MFSRPFFAGAMLAVLLLPPALADDGHNHDAAPAAPTGAAWPRFAASSELFELVGVLQGRQLTVYLDHFADNAPVRDAQVELDIGGNKVELKPHGEGEFEGALASELKPGVVAVTATVRVGNETDLLAGDLDLHADAPAGAAHVHGVKEYLGWGAAALGALAVLLWAVRRLRAGQRVGGAA